MSKKISYALAIGVLMACTSAQSAEIGWAFTIQNGSPTGATLTFGNDPGKTVTGGSVAASTGIGEAWLFNLSGSGHGSDGGLFAFVPFAWNDLTAGLFNNLYYLGNDAWRLETDQTTAAPGTQVLYGTPGFNLGTSLNAGLDAFNGDAAFASVNELVSRVPEPSTIALAGLALFGLLATQRRRVR